MHLGGNEIRGADDLQSKASDALSSDKGEMVSDASLDRVRRGVEGDGGERDDPSPARRREGGARALGRLAVLTQQVVDVARDLRVEWELSRNPARINGGLSCLTLMPG